MSYLVLARKWRPSTFDQMVGQEFVSRTLQNAVKSGRVAHAFLFSGSRGVGKTSAARILARCLNCDHGPTPEPCNQCSACREIAEGRSLEVLEIDGASNTSVDDIRELRENIKYLPRPGKRRIYIIDEVHMLSRSAFNALLKTLEEPPAHVVFIFATTEPHKVPDTIQSRCQRYDFRRIPPPKLMARLREMVASEGIEIPETALNGLVKAADGSMRDAQSLLDQMVSYCGLTISDEAVREVLGLAGRALFFKISGAVLAEDAQGCLSALDELYRQGVDVGPFYRDLVEHFRNLLVAGTLTDPSAILDMSNEEIAELKQQAGHAGIENLQRLVSMLMKAEGEVLGSSFPRMALEVTLVRMAHLSRLQPLDKILEKINELYRAAGGEVRSKDVPAGVSRPTERTDARPSAPSRQADRPAGRGRAEGSSPKPPAVGAMAPKEVPVETAAPCGPDVGPGESLPSKSDPSDFVRAVRRESEALAALLEDVVRWEIGADGVKAFCEGSSFLYQKLCRQDAKDLFTRVARECFGASATFRASPIDLSKDGSERLPGKGLGEEAHGDSTVDSQKKPARNEEASRNPTVKEALDLFHGQIKEVKPPEDRGGK